MPIRETTLTNHGLPFLYLLPTDTLLHTFGVLHEHNLALNKTYIVFRTQAGDWKLQQGLGCIRWIALLGDNALTLPLEALPFGTPSRIEQMSMPGSGLTVIDWLAQRPSATVLILRDETVAGVFANHVRSDAGSVDRTILNALHGPFATLAKDVRLVLERLPQPMCPHCQSQQYYEFNVVYQTYVCPSCKKEIATP